MIKITEKLKCTGCFSCALSCPKNCIEMTEDNEGFLYPLVDTSACVDCGLCERNCPVITPAESDKTKDDITAYAAFTKDDEIRYNSSSGGIFTEIANVVLDDGGVVFGASFDEEFSVKHIEITQKEDLKKLRVSKYVQSRIGHTYKSAKEYLEQGRGVLFSGTPCQIAGLYSFLGKRYENLITQDIICHGVPSPLVWKKYKKEQKGKLTDISFRDKSEGWSTYSVRMSFKDREEFKQKARENEYIKSFLSNICLRPSCYNCQFKDEIRQSDITLADFWGVENVVPEMFDDKGTSLVFVNSKKGEELFEKIKENIIFKEADKDNAVKYNKSMVQSAFLHPNRERFMKQIANKNASFSVILEKNIKISLVKRGLNKIKRIVSK